MIDRDRLASAMSWLLAGIALHVFDIRVGVLDVVPDPAGAVVVLVGVLRVRASTPRTSVGPVLVGAAGLHVVLTVANEMGVLTGAVATGGAGFADTSESGTAWQVVAGSNFALTVLGVLLLALHLRAALEGVASDRWRQVALATAAEGAAVILVWAVDSIELLFATIALGAIAGVLLLVSLFATRRAAEEDDLARQFPT